MFISESLFHTLVARLFLNALEFVDNNRREWKSIAFVFLQKITMFQTLSSLPVPVKSHFVRMRRYQKIDLSVMSHHWRKMIFY